MKPSNPFVIQFSGLKDGKHEFNFTIDQAFFDENNFWIDISGNLSLDVELEKQPTMLILDFKIKGVVTVPCDRCTAPLNQRINIVEKLYVKFGEDSFQETDDIIFLPENEYKIDITPYVFEFINLALPMKMVHDEGKCDEDMVKVIERYIRKDSDEDNNEIDPRWDKLKDFKNN